MKNINDKTHKRVGKGIRTGMLLRWGLFGALSPLTIGASDLDNSYKVKNELNSNQGIYQEMTSPKDSYSPRKTINIYDAMDLSRTKYSNGTKKVMKGGKN